MFVPKPTIGFFKPVLKPETLGRNMASSIYFPRSVVKPIIVQAHELNQLLGRNDCYRTHEGKKVLRFLLKTDGTLVFGAEGHPVGHIPSHAQLANQKDPLEAECITAGNVFFDENNRLCAIDNKSGDFRPEFNTLQFAVEALIDAQVPMLDQLTIVKLNSSGAEEMAVEVNTADLFDAFGKTYPKKRPNQRVSISEDCIPFPVRRAVAHIPQIVGTALASASYNQCASILEDNDLLPIPIVDSPEVMNPAQVSVFFSRSLADKLKDCGSTGQVLEKQIKRLEQGSKSRNPYWMNSSRKLRLIRESLAEQEHNLTGDELNALLHTPKSKLYKALNMRRITPLTILGSLGWNFSKSLRSVIQESNSSHLSI